METQLSLEQVTLRSVQAHQTLPLWFQSAQQVRETLQQITLRMVIRIGSFRHQQNSSI
jgi:hypothetical protein